jgi:hypothetical protein
VEQSLGLFGFCLQSAVSSRPRPFSCALPLRYVSCFERTRCFGEQTLVAAIRGLCANGTEPQPTAAAMQKVSTMQCRHDTEKTHSYEPCESVPVAPVAAGAALQFIAGC